MFYKIKVCSTEHYIRIDNLVRIKVMWTHKYAPNIRVPKLPTYLSSNKIESLIWERHVFSV